MLDEWETIVPPSDPRSYNVRLADSSHSLDFRIGRDYRGRFVFQLDADYSETGALELPKMSAMTCEVESSDSGRSRLILSLNNPADLRNFTLMCKGLMLATAGLKPTQSGEGLRKALEEVHRWQEMLRRRAERLLSKNERIGLVGELLFLRDVLGTRLDWKAAIQCWNGPSGHEQDFVIAGSIFEVKTQVVTADRWIQIASEDQLDPVRGRILLCNQGIAPVPRADLVAITLNSLVIEIRDAIAEAGSDATQLLDIALLEAGYEHREEYDEESWVLVDRAFYTVSGNFPRIERRDLRLGVEKVKYSIRVNDCVPFKVREDDVFGEIIQ